MLQIAKNAQAVLDDEVRFAALDVGNESDAAGVLVECRIVQALRRRRAGIGGGGAQQISGARARGDPAFDKSRAAPVLAHLILPRRRQCFRVLASGAPALSAGPLRRRVQRATDLEKGSLARSSPPWLLPLGATDVSPAFKGRHRDHRY